LGKPSSAGEGSLDLGSTSDKAQTGSSADVPGGGARGSAGKLTAGKQNSQESVGGEDGGGDGRGSAFKKGSSSLLELARAHRAGSGAQAQEGGDGTPKRKSKSKKDLAEELAALVTHVQGVGFKSFEDSRERQKCYQMSSFAEKKTNKLAKENLREVCMRPKHGLVLCW
jgi:hypothetical protein